MTNNTEILHEGMIQFWQFGSMMGLITKKEAIQLVNEGNYKVINDQSIEWIGV